MFSSSAQPRPSSSEEPTSHLQPPEEPSSGVNVKVALSPTNVHEVCPGVSIVVKREIREMGGIGGQVDSSSDNDGDAAGDAAVNDEYDENGAGQVQREEHECGAGTQLPDEGDGDDVD